ncbi:unnamed protein product [Acanthocheilonema viteae]|uniref:Uncharacterized protein n=1 Tax=Acanthocheilonema viteae TaxID=6277 RepID=A0A498SVQ4_ACAVI|nr:unnamed protein product [Acanthocheilonema viteae]
MASVWQRKTLQNGCSFRISETENMKEEKEKEETKMSYLEEKNICIPSSSISFITVPSFHVVQGDEPGISPHAIVGKSASCFQLSRRHEELVVHYTIDTILCYI